MKVYGFICLLLLVYCRIFSNNSVDVSQKVSPAMLNPSAKEVITKPAKSVKENNEDLSIAAKTTEIKEKQLNLMSNLPVNISFPLLDLAATVR